MNHLILFSLCILSVEIIFRSHFLTILDSFFIVTKKVIAILSSENISDHWKEKAIPAYALRLIVFSLKTFLIFFCIISLFFIANYFLNDFFIFILSLSGIAESIFFTVAYIIFRKLILNE